MSIYDAESAAKKIGVSKRQMGRLLAAAGFRPSVIGTRKRYMLTEAHVQQIEQTRRKSLTVKMS